MYIVGLPYDGLPFAPQLKCLSFPGDGLTFFSRNEMDDVKLTPDGSIYTRPPGHHSNPDGSYSSSGFTYYSLLIVPSYDYFCAYDGPDLADFPLHSVTNVDWNRKTILRLIKSLEGSFHKVTYDAR